MPIPELDSYVKKGEALKASKREAAPKMTLPIFEEMKIPGRRPGR
jgi:hypothetical protein